MKKILLLLGGSVLLHTAVSAQTQPHYNRCGMQMYHAEMMAQDPTYAAKLAAQKNSLQAAADYYIQLKRSGELERTSSTVSAVPIIFHILVDSAQFNLLGGTAGIIQRCDSQIAVLNRDYNMQNPDSTKIPSLWKSLYGNVGIHFGLARVDPSGNCSPGYEIRIIPGSTTTDGGFSSINQVKGATNGLAAWDVSKYYNVWCTNFLGGLNGLLGITQPKSDGATSTKMGVVILFNTLGCTAQNGAVPPGTGGSAGWPYPYNLGRTLTHETGHFFEIWHPWGDDGGACPWSGGSDDGLTDTPPEADNIYGNPTYTVAGGTITDACLDSTAIDVQPIGIACLSYMDYTDDDAMYMFTTMQAAVMSSMALVPPGSAGTTSGTGSVGENYNLTQNPSLLIPCTTSSTAVAPSPTEINSSLSVYPNPTTGEINVSINSQAETLHTIAVFNLLGQQVAAVKGIAGKDYYSLNISGMSKGIYFVKFDFASGSVTRKVLLQ